MDGTTDAGNIEQEMVLVLYCKRDDAAQEIRSCTRYLAVAQPSQADANGLIECLRETLVGFGVDDI